MKVIGGTLTILQLDKFTPTAMNFEFVRSTLQNCDSGCANPTRLSVREFPAESRETHNYATEAAVIVISSPNLQ